MPAASLVDLPPELLQEVSLDIPFSSAISLALASKRVCALLSNVIEDPAPQAAFPTHTRSLRALRLMGGPFQHWPELSALSWLEAKITVHSEDDLVMAVKAICSMPLMERLGLRVEFKDSKNLSRAKSRRPPQSPITPSSKYLRYMRMEPSGLTHSALTDVLGAFIAGMWMVNADTLETICLCHEDQDRNSEISLPMQGVSQDTVLHRLRRIRIDWERQRFRFSPGTPIPPWPWSHAPSMEECIIAQRGGVSPLMMGRGRVSDLPRGYLSSLRRLRTNSADLLVLVECKELRLEEIFLDNIGTIEDVTSIYALEKHDDLPQLRSVRNFGLNISGGLSQKTATRLFELFTETFPALERLIIEESMHQRNVLSSDLETYISLFSSFENLTHLALLAPIGVPLPITEGVGASFPHIRSMQLAGFVRQEVGNVPGEGYEHALYKFEDGQAYRLEDDEDARRAVLWSRTIL